MEKKISAFLHKKTSNQRVIFIFWIICQNKDFCEIEMPSEKNKISKFNQFMKSDKMPYVIYDDLVSLIKKLDVCANNLEKSSTTKIGGYNFLWIFSINNLWVWSHKRQTYFISWKRLYGKVLWIFKRTLKRNNWFWKENNVAVNKQGVKIIWKCKSMLLLRKTYHKKPFKYISYRKVRDHCY